MAPLLAVSFRGRFFPDLPEFNSMLALFPSLVFPLNPFYELLEPLFLPKRSNILFSFFLRQSQFLVTLNGSRLLEYFTKSLLSSCIFFQSLMEVINTFLSLYFPFFLLGFHFF